MFKFDRKPVKTQHAGSMEEPDDEENKCYRYSKVALMVIIWLLCTVSRHKIRSYPSCPAGKVVRLQPDRLLNTKIIFQAILMMKSEKLPKMHQISVPEGKVKSILLITRSVCVLLPGGVEFGLVIQYQR